MPAFLQSNPTSGVQDYILVHGLPIIAGRQAGGYGGIPTAGAALEFELIRGA